MGAILAVAVADDFKVRYPLEARLPADTVRTSVRLKAPFRLTPAVLLMVNPFSELPAKAPEGMVCADEPFSSMAPALAANVPLLVIAPAMVKRASVPSVRVAPD